MMLDKLLGILHSYELRGLSFSIVVSDDNSTDNTHDIILKWSCIFMNFKYNFRTENDGMDYNFQTAYEMCDTDYCWLLGDARYISYEGLEKILSLISKGNCDALILHWHKSMCLDSKDYVEINQLLLEQGWQMTNNASCVIPRSFIDKNLYTRYIGTTFLHYGIIVENLCLKENFRVKYVSDVDVKDLRVIGYDKKSWNSKAFLNFGKLWYEFIMSLPNQIDIKTKETVLLSHNHYTRLFSLHVVAAGVAQFGYTYYHCYRSNRKYVQFVSKLPTLVYDIVIPTLLLLRKPLIYLRNYYQRRKYGCI